MEKANFYFFQEMDDMVKSIDFKALTNSFFLRYNYKTKERNVHDDDENRGMDHLPEGVPR